MADTAYARRLKADGYTFQGAYSWDKEEMKKRAVELRKLGNKAVVVWTPASKYSRSSSGGGWSVYWKESEANKAQRLATAANNQLSRLMRERQECEQRIKAIDAEMSEIRNRF